MTNEQIKMAILTICIGYMVKPETRDYLIENGLIDQDRNITEKGKTYF